MIALALILFEGGLAAGLGEIRPVLRPALSLALLGTLITAVVTGLAASWLFDFSTLEGLLLGSIIASTDGAAVFSLLRGAGLRQRLERTLEGEAGFNDPIAVLLVLGFIEWIMHPDYGLPDMLLLFVQQLGIGLVAGRRGRRARRARRSCACGSRRPGLYPVASLAAAALAFGAADALHGSGFLAVYLAGLALGSADMPGEAHRDRVPRGPGLGRAARHVPHARPARVPVRSSTRSRSRGTLLALVVVFVARPARDGDLDGRHAASSLREKALLGWAGLRGAVPVVLAIFPVIEGVPRAREFFNIVFFAVLLSTILQGTTIEPRRATGSG